MTRLSWDTSNVYVTGGTGFVGTWLVKALVSRGANVVLLVREGDAPPPIACEGPTDRVTVVAGDVVDLEASQQILSEHDIDTVFHLAAQAIAGVARQDPLATFETNVRGTWCVLEACRKYGRAKRILVASSDRVYGALRIVGRGEEGDPQATHPYHVSKSCADLIARAYCHTWSLPIALTRCGNIFGPGDINFSRIVPGTIRSVLKGERPVIRSDGSPVGDYVHVFDVVAGYLLLAEGLDRQELRGQACSFSSGEPMTVLDLTSRIMRAAGRDDLEPIILNQATDEAPTPCPALDRARELLGWRPERTVDERIRETVAWYRDYFQCVPIESSRSAEPRDMGRTTHVSSTGDAT